MVKKDSLVESKQKKKLPFKKGFSIPGTFWDISKKVFLRKTFCVYWIIRRTKYFWKEDFRRVRIYIGCLGFV